MELRKVRGCGNKEGMTCDARRGNEPIKVNPCDAGTLRGITYTSTGRIQSSDPEIDEDINVGDPKMPYVGIMIWWLGKHT